MKNHVWSTTLSTLLLKETIRDINSSLVVSLDTYEKYPNYNSNTESLGYVNKIPQKGFRFVA